MYDQNTIEHRAASSRPDMFLLCYEYWFSSNRNVGTVFVIEHGIGTSYWGHEVNLSSYFGCKLRSVPHVLEISN